MKKVKGFTIIEVLLVLAIAGLIFMMIFIAYPALTRSQRDTDRRESVMSFLKEVKNYQTNNRGALPGAAETTSDDIVATWETAKNLTGKETTWGGFYRDYLGEKFMDPNGENYKIIVTKCGAGAVGSECTSNTAKGLSGAVFPNNFRLVVVLQATCDGEKAVGVANPRKLAAMYKLEGGGVMCEST